VWTPPVWREERAIPWTVHRTRGPQRPHASIRSLTKRRIIEVERVTRRLRRRHIEKEGGNASDPKPPLVFPPSFTMRLSTGKAGRRVTRWDLQRALRISVTR
jgi:hypothetical protein